jgi:prepilin-type N-terminal cleavage/methylation domain-containing protein
MTHRRLLLLRHTQSGFSLVELAVVMMVLGLLLGSVLLSLSKQDEIKRTKLTDERLDAVREAIIGFAVANGRLPRPALAVTNGNERAACATDADCTGFIPWTLLGVQRLDGFDKLIRYSVTPDFANASFTMTTVPTKSVWSRNTTGVVVDLAGAATCTAINGCTPAVIYSVGKNNFGTTMEGVALPATSATNTDESTNNTATVSFVSREYTTSTTAVGGDFDDRVTWLPSAVLLSRMVQAGRLP